MDISRLFLSTAPTDRQRLMSSSSKSTSSYHKITGLNYSTLYNLYLFCELWIFFFLYSLSDSYSEWFICLSIRICFHVLNYVFLCVQMCDFGMCGNNFLGSFLAINISCNSLRWCCQRSNAKEGSV